MANNLSPKMRKARTATIHDIEVDFRVLSFTSHDSSFLASIGKHSHESRWLIEVGGTPEPIDICVTVDKQVLASPEVSVTCNGNRVLPAASSGTVKQKLKEDFSWKWPFRGLIRGIGVPQYFEVRPEGMRYDQWFPATVTEQLEDGSFKATVFLPDSMGRVRGFDYPTVTAKNLREAGGMKAPVTIPQCSLVLHLPMQDPLHSTLFVERDQTSEPELITHFFARRTPPVPKGLMGSPPTTDPKIRLEVTKDRKKVKCSVGYLTLKDYLSGEVRMVSREASSKLKQTWVIQVGPVARHTIQIEKTKASSKVVTLTVDGEVLCEATAEDIDHVSDGGQDSWECGFRLFGQRFLEWQVYHTNMDGTVQNTTGEILQRTAYVHQCVVSFQDNNVSEALLTIDGREFHTLPDCHAHDISAEAPLECSPEAFLGSFGLIVPFKVDPNAATGLKAVAASAASSGGFFASLFTCCANTGAGNANDVIILPGDNRPQAVLKPGELTTEDSPRGFQ